MLHLVLGRSGFGKTQYVLDSIRAFAQDEQHASDICYWIVPEQASFEAERAAVRTLGENDAARVRVLSFTRMCETLMKQHTDTPLSNGAKIMLMSRAVSELQDRLSTLGTAKRVDAVEAFLDIVAECRQTGVSAQMLADGAKALPEGRLRQKAEELSLLLDTYDTLLSQSGTDPQELLARFAEFLNEHRRLENTVIFVDGFKGFTAPEIQVLGAMMGQAQSITVTLCTDRLHDEYEGMDRFSVVMKTAKRLITLAEENGCAVSKPTTLMTPYRFQNDALEALEATVFTAERFEVTPSDAVTVTRCADIYEESDYVARTIRRLMREHHYRAREIAVVARNLSEYVGVLDVSLEHADIPYYLDRRSAIASESSVTAVLTAVSLAVDGLKSDMLIRLMKTGLLGFSVTSAALLENYVYMWNITGSQFKSVWTMHPRGFEASMNAADTRALARINRLRSRLMRPLITLSKALSGAVSGEEFAKAVYAYIKHAKLDRTTAWQVARLRQNGENALAEHTVQVWNAFIALLDDAVAVFGNENIAPAEAAQLLRAAACATDVGTIPQTLDAVQIGAADRMRFTSPKVVFVLGANEGVFPAVSESRGVLNDRERAQLAAVNVPFEDHRTQNTADEQFYAYTAVSAASERVYVSFLSVIGERDRSEPSSLVHSVTSCLPYIEEQSAVADDGSDIEFAADAFERMASGFRAQTPLSKALCQVLYEDERYRARIDTMTRLAKDAPIAFEDSAVAKDFFGEHMVLSATLVESYYKCGFSYFCKYGLKVEPRKKAEWNALENGTLMHFVLENTLPAYIAEDIQTIDKARCFADAKTLSERYVKEQMGGFDDKPDRFVRLFERLTGVCGHFLWHAVSDLQQSHFVPVDYELNIGMGNKKDSVPSLRIQLPDEGSVTVNGKIDRVDLYDDGTRRFVRVIDYKTGKKEFKLTEVVEGINLQMLIYMITLCENGKARYGDVLPAGMLYMLSKMPTIKVEPNSTPEKLAQQALKAMRMNGLLLNDEQVLQAMEPGVHGVFVPAELKKGGELYASRSSVATLAQFGKLGKRAKKLLAEMAMCLHDGKIDARPFTDDPCQYCDYKAVCGHEEGDRIREPQFEKDNQVLEALDSEEEEA